MPELDEYVLAVLRAEASRRYLDGFTCRELTADLTKARRVAGKPPMTGAQISGALRRLKTEGHVDYEPRKQVFMGTAPHRPSGWGWQQAMWFLREDHR